MWVELALVATNAHEGIPAGAEAGKRPKKKKKKKRAGEQGGGKRKKKRRQGRRALRFHIHAGCRPSMAPLGHPARSIRIRGAMFRSQHHLQPWLGFGLRWPAGFNEIN